MEILFRGFHPCEGPDTIVVDGEKVKGRWVEGYIVKHPSAIQIGNDYSPWYIHVPPVDPDDNGGVFNVLPSTVGQWTGLKDKKGVKIFEHDIVKMRGYAKQPHKAIVYFPGGKFAVDGTNYGFKDLKPSTYEVIGTVFDEVTP